MLRETKILDVYVTNELEKYILEYLFDRLKSGKNKTFIITPNPEMLIYASKHLDYRDKLNEADIALADGIGLFFAAGFKGEELRDRITGVDFIESICKEAKEKAISMGFLGGRDGIAELAVKRLKKKYPWRNTVFISEEWHDKAKIPTMDILFVAFGVPKQEEWIYKNLDKIPVKAAMGVGGAFDYISGTVTRAPYVVRLLGFEWLFRLLKQPWRWKRQMAILEFILLVFKQKLTNN
jgi:N-acetylglucosaminyldiphosphoundecaprenol N-acetyl-beta-D-mannosaminyltransferase